RRAFLRQGNIEERCKQRGILRRIELDLRERAFQVGKPALRRNVGAAETLATPFGDRMQGGVLQKLRAAPFHPGMRRVGEPRMKFPDKARFSHARLADYQNQLPVALACSFPAPHQRGDFLVAADKRREMALARTATATARPYEPEQRYRFWHAFQVMGA